MAKSFDRCHTFNFLKFPIFALCARSPCALGRVSFALRVNRAPFTLSRAPFFYAT